MVCLYFELGFRRIKQFFLNIAGPESMLELLIDHGGDINALNKDKDSVLIMAIHSGIFNILKVSHELYRRKFPMIISARIR